MSTAVVIRRPNGPPQRTEGYSGGFRAAITAGVARSRFPLGFDLRLQLRTDHSHALAWLVTAHPAPECVPIVGVRRGAAILSELEAKPTLGGHL